MSASPLSSARLSLLDGLRGLAVLGILMDNIQEFAMPRFGFFYPISFGNISGLNRLALLVSHFGFQGRFFVIMMLVFGAGIALAHSHGKGWRFQTRRCLCLGAIGLVHGLFLWDGDILLVMAMVGIVAAIAVKLPTRWLIALVFILGLGGQLSVLAVSRGIPQEQAHPHLSPSTDWEPPTDWTIKEIRTMRGTWEQQQARRLERLTEMVRFVIPAYLFWRVLALTMAGVVLFRTGFLTGNASPATYAASTLGALLVGLPLSMSRIQNWILPDAELRLAFIMGSAYEFLVIGISALGWVGAICLLARMSHGRRLLAPLAAVGQMSLSNYIGQTLLATGVFYGFGAGLFGSVSRTGQLAFVLGVWIFQILVSNWWLQRFGIGPMEFLWRRAVYGASCRQAP